MQKLLLFSIVLLLISCGKDNTETEQNLVGTWTLSSVEGTCLSIPTNASANNLGCIDIPTLEVNCSIIEIQAGGTLKYAYDLIEGTGTYTIDGDEITLCTDRCLTYLLDGNVLTLQTGTIALCDPLYSFTKSSNSLTQIITDNQRKFLSSIAKNGVTTHRYSYNTDGSLQSLQKFFDDGSLFYTEAYVFTPLTVTRTRTFASNGAVRRYEYYNESPTRTRRDYYGESGTVEQYRLYFHGTNGCWVDKTEDYQNNTLVSLSNYTYDPITCAAGYMSYTNGDLTSIYTSQRDGKSYYAQSTLLNILQYNTISNRTAATYVRDGEVDTDSSFNSVYTYNDADYPITEVRTYLDGTVDLYTYTYE